MDGLYNYPKNPIWFFWSDIYQKFHFQEKIDTIHENVIRGDLRSVRTLLDKKGWANARDHYGHSPLHKSVMANQEEVMRFILESYPDHVEDRDNVTYLCNYGNE